MILSAPLAASAAPVVLVDWDLAPQITMLKTIDDVGPLGNDAGMGFGKPYGFHNSKTAKTPMFVSRVGNGCTARLSSNIWQVGDYYDVASVSKGYNNLTLRWD